MGPEARRGCGPSLLARLAEHPCCLHRDIGKRLEVRKTVTACLGEPSHITQLEHVQARLTLSYNRRGDLAIHLVSPMGTCSTLLASSSGNYSTGGFSNWAFMLSHSWNEDPSGSGSWRLKTPAKPTTVGH